jgi:hypothetical protein
MPNDFFTPVVIEDGDGPIELRLKLRQVENNLYRGDQIGFSRFKDGIRYRCELEQLRDELQLRIKEATANDPTAWIKFSEAKALTGLRDDEITRACDPPHKVRYRGKGKGRLVHAGDLARFALDRLKRQR